MVITAEAKIYTKFGKFLVTYHRDPETNEDCIVLSKNNKRKKHPLVRIQSACILSESFGTIDCDCNLQLEHSLKKIGEYKYGALVYLFQEGRGIGIEKKIKSIALEQKHKIDTIEAFKKQGLPIDPREYHLAAVALNDLNFPNKIYLITNNPIKKTKLEQLGFQIVKKISIEFPVTHRIKRYLKIKKNKMGHEINIHNFKKIQKELQ